MQIPTIPEKQDTSVRSVHSSHKKLHLTHSEAQYLMHVSGESCCFSWYKMSLQSRNLRNVSTKHCFALQAPQHAILNSRCTLSVLGILLRLPNPPTLDPSRRSRRHCQNQTFPARAAGCRESLAARQSAALTDSEITAGRISHGTVTVTIHLDRDSESVAPAGRRPPSQCRDCRSRRPRGHYRST